MRMPHGRVTPQLAMALATLLASAGCSDLGRPLRPAPEPLLSVVSLDFGTLALADSTMRDVTVSNTGTGPLAGNASVSCPEYRIESGGGPFVVAPGGEHRIRLVFTPGAVGTYPCTLDLGYQAGRVELTGAGALQTPGAQSLVVPDSLDFGVVAAGQSVTRSFQVFSVGTAPLAVNIVPACDEFEVLTGGGSSTLAPGSSVTVTVRFTPTTGRGHGCSLAIGPGVGDVPLSGFATTVSFAADVQPILASYCTGCHLFDDADGYRILTQERIFSYAPGVRVIPFDLTNSVLYGKITNSGQYGQSMPQGSPLIPLADRDLIRDWILEGARDN